MVTGFEYDVELADGERRWCQFMGKGGLLGTGCVHAFRERPTNTLRFLLTEARKRATQGPLLEFISWDVAPADRFREVVVAAVHDVRAVTI